MLLDFAFCFCLREDSFISVNRVNVWLSTFSPLGFLKVIVFSMYSVHLWLLLHWCGCLIMSPSLFGVSWPSGKSIRLKLCFSIIICRVWVRVPVVTLVSLKPLDTFGKHYYPRATLRVSQLLYKITNLWKFRLNPSSESGENNGKTHPCLLLVSPCHDMCLK